METHSFPQSKSWQGVVLRFILERKASSFSQSVLALRWLPGPCLQALGETMQRSSPEALTRSPSENTVEEEPYSRPLTPNPQVTIMGVSSGTKNWVAHGRRTTIRPKVHYQPFLPQGKKYLEWEKILQYCRICVGSETQDGVKTRQFKVCQGTGSTFTFCTTWMHYTIR